MGERFRRGFIIFMVVLFAATSLGIGVWGFIEATRQDNSNTQEDAVNQENQLQGKPLAGFTPVEKVESLQKIDKKVGEGAEATPDSTVTAHYTGAVAATGIVFQSSFDSGQPIPFSLKEVIRGWVEGVPGMREGGERRLLIPAALAYGPNPPPGSGIPPNADLVFDIVLVKVE